MAKVICPSCKGTGMKIKKDGGKTCPKCHGRGEF